MEGLKPPAHWDMDSSNLAKSWKSWKEEFILYMGLALPDADETARVMLFRYHIGEHGRELCNTKMSGVSTADRMVGRMIAKFDEHCTPIINETVERYRFFARNQSPNEAIDKYVTDLRRLASTCNFGELQDSLIRDRIVCGTHSSSRRERLLREDDLTLDKCLRVYRAMEISREHSKTIGQVVEEVHALQRKTKTDKSMEISCKFCGKVHERQKAKCPAFGKKCKKCGKENHFTVTCRSKVSYREHRKKVHTVTQQDSDSCEDIMTVTAVTQEMEAVNHVKEAQNNKLQLFAGMMINNNLVRSLPRD